MAKESNKRRVLNRRKQELDHAIKHKLSASVVVRRAEAIRIAVLAVIKKSADLYSGPIARLFEVRDKWLQLTTDEIVELARKWPAKPRVRDYELRNYRCVGNRREDGMDEVPERLIRYPTQAGQDSLAARLGLTIGPNDQDWEYTIADSARFDEWLAVYRDDSLSDDERFSLMEMLIQCVEYMARDHSPSEVDVLPQWSAVAALLRDRPQLHAATIAYWSVFEGEDPEEQFRVSLPMRKVWAEVKLMLSE